MYITDEQYYILPFWVSLLLALGREKVGPMGGQAGGKYWTGSSFWGTRRDFPLDGRYSRAGWAVLCLAGLLVVVVGWPV